MNPYLIPFKKGKAATAESTKEILEELLPALNMDELPHMTFHRVGLNYADIERLGLSWIENLETSGGGDLASPKHKQHYSKPVQDYLSKYGARKCEANALLRNPAAAEAIMQDAIDQYIDHSAFEAYLEARRQDREEARLAVDKALEAIAA